MKFLEGKTPQERNKIIAAMVLGFLAVLVLGYTFLGGSSSSKKTTANTNKNSNANKGKLVDNNTAGPLPPANNLQKPEDVRNKDDFFALTALPDNPFPIYAGDSPNRNIFALYEPPPPAPPKVVVPLPSPLPSPPPPPPMFVQYINPSAKFSGEKDFTLEVAGDKFTPDSRVLFNGMEVPTTYASPQRLTANIAGSLINGEGQRQVSVRTPDGTMFSNVSMFTVQAPPAPNFNFVGLVARKRFNNDTAILQDKTNKQVFQNVRLDELVGGRFKVVSISSKEVMLQDTQLGFRHKLPYADEKSSGGRSSTSATTTTARPNTTVDGFGNVQFQTIDPNQQIPGIPNQFVQQPQPQQKRDVANDDEDDDN